MIGIGGIFRVRAVRAAILAVCATIGLLGAPGPAEAEKRVALVVGNAAYRGDLTPLSTTGNDARLMSDSLKGLGFEVVMVVDGDRAAIDAAIRTFGNKLSAADPDAIGLFFYSGHGFQMRGQNYLMPVDAEVKSETTIERTSISVDEVLRAMADAGNAVNLVFLNACRTDIPTPTGESGLARQEAVTGTFIGYATAPNALAWDGAGKYTPYARALAREIAEPGQSIPIAHFEVRQAVMQATGNRQVPWDTSSLTRDVVLASGSADSARQDDPAKTLRFYNWTNYFPPELLDLFSEETGVEVTMVPGYESNEELHAALTADVGDYDVVVPSDYLVEILARDGLLLQIDAPTLPNWSNIDRRFQKPAYDPKRKYSIPYVWGTTGLSYDTAQVPGGKLTDSWKEFFEPRAELKGRIASLDDEIELYNAAAYYLGLDKCTTNPADAQRILDLLLKQQESVALYSSVDTIERMTAGDVALHLQWNGAAYRARGGRETLRYLYPKEGLGFWQDAVVIPRNAPHPESARLFIDWLLKPEVAAAITNYTGYMNAIPGSRQFMRPVLLKDPAINMPEQYFERLRPTQACSSQARALRANAWRTLRGAE